MKSAKFLVLLCALALPAAAAAAPLSPASQLERDLQKAASLACVHARQAFPGNLPALAGDCTVSSLTRREIVPGIAEYSFVLSLGSGPGNAIGLHRVVRETAPYEPAPTDEAVLLAHGDAWGFDAAFLAAASSPHAPDTQALPVFLASHGIDVWGIDFGWALLPASTADFGFLAGWGIERDARDLGVALALARNARTRSEGGHEQVHLLGWSRGGLVGYAYLDAETQVPAGLRSAAGFIPVDIYLKTDVEDFRQAACRRAAAQQALLAAGTYASNTGTLLGALGQLALAAPDAPSPILPGLTNRQAALLAGAATFTFFPPDQQFVPFYHFAAGSFAASGLPSGLLYTGEPYWFDFLAGASPYQPVRLVADSEAALCDEADVPFDDHLAEITVPVLYLGAGGGFGEYGVYTTTLLGSRDVQVRIVDLLPGPARLFDFGHADLFTSAQAEALAWQAILDWLQAH